MNQAEPAGLPLKKPPNAMSIKQLRATAERRLPACVFNFFDGAAEDEVTASANLKAFSDFRLVPRVLVDVENVDLNSTIVGCRAKAPIVIAPMGGVGAAWPKGDIAIARAASRVGIPYVLSTMATCSIEEVADAAPGALWFQLYVLRDEPYNEALLNRAHAAGYEALVVSVDVPIAGKRERDSLRMPMRWDARTLKDFLGHPGWLLQMCINERPRFKNLDGLVERSLPGLSVAEIVSSSLDASVNWERIARIRDRWKRKLIVKGVMSPIDAMRLAETGVDAVWVSNHGGRQLDGAQSSAAALDAVSRTLMNKLPVIVDSGIRRGGDVLKAVALGAQAVAIGRPVVYGVAAAGEAGAHLALEILVDELKRCMQLCGVTGIAGITADLIAA